MCIIIIFILLGKIKDTLSKISTPFIINGIFTILLGMFVSSMLSTAEFNSSTLPINIINLFSLPFHKVGMLWLFIGIVLVIMSRILKSNKSIENSNNAIENLSNVNYIPNNNVSNTPYNGYQNH